MTKQWPKAILILLLFIALIVLSGCDNQSKGFALPEGSAEVGRATFIELNCNQCHSIIKDVDKAEPGHPELHVPLGGTTTRVRTYGGLVTSIINPSHKISFYTTSGAHIDSLGKSKMRLYNEEMTVQQLVDLTTYLQGTYQIVRPRDHYYYGP